MYYGKMRENYLPYKYLYTRIYYKLVFLSDDLSQTLELRELAHINRRQKKKSLQRQKREPYNKF